MGLAEAELERRALGLPAGSFALPSVFHFKDDVIRDRTRGIDRKLNIFGLDINHYTCRSKNERLSLIEDCKANVRPETFHANGISFVYLKASEGVKFRDRTFAHFWNTFGALPAAQQVPRGAYHFLRPGSTAEAQAALFLSELEAVHALPLSKYDLPPALDVEALTASDIWAGIPTDKIVAMIKTWGDVVKARTGRTPIIYTGAAFLSAHGIGADILNNELAGYDLWIASYYTCAGPMSCEGIVNDKETYSKVLYKDADGKAIRQRTVLWQFSTRAVIDPGEYDTGYTCPAAKECLDVVRFEREPSTFFASFPNFESRPGR